MKEASGEGSMTIVTIIIIAAIAIAGGVIVAIALNRAGDRAENETIQTTITNCPAGQYMKADGTCATKP